MTACGHVDDSDGGNEMPQRSASPQLQHRRRRSAEFDAGSSAGLPADEPKFGQRPSDKTFIDALDQRDAVADAFFQQLPTQPSKSNSANNGLTAGDLACLGDTLNVDDKVTNLMRDRN
eukprot:CAMPEP_0197416616 /NCGR_PEP_ID=MMETSP1170-20131217/2883_1 /TAXON_ID=54406 /ORGANISM="Sarcinochrysis sp, Strain CCMP770" /LENGTH=117 /DNA_ID=CAMNT_0042943523 /DNA_START=144 /DNA_END=497 /DNA_ORIENTATION=+